MYTHNLSDMKAKPRIIFQFAIFDLSQYLYEVPSNAYDLSDYWIHMLTSSDSLVTIIRPRAKENVRTIAMMLLHISNKKGDVRATLHYTLWLH
jgi:hypothetical protein